MKIYLNHLNGKETEERVHAYKILSEKYTDHLTNTTNCFVCGDNRTEEIGDDLIRLVNCKLYIVEDEKN